MAVRKEALQPPSIIGVFVGSFVGNTYLSTLIGNTEHQILHDVSVKL